MEVLRFTILYDARFFTNNENITNRRTNRFFFSIHSFTISLLRLLAFELEFQRTFLAAQYDEWMKLNMS